MAFPSGKAKKRPFARYGTAGKELCRHADIPLGLGNESAPLQWGVGSNLRSFAGGAARTGGSESTGRFGFHPAVE